MSYIEPEQNQVTDFLNHRNFLVKDKLSFPSLNPDQVMDFDVVFVLWSDGGKLMAKTGPAFVPSRLSAIWIARELSRSCHAEDGTQEAWPKRARGVMGGEENRITPCARALSWGGIIFRAPISCLDSLLGCLRRYFGVFLWDCLFPSLISLLKGTDYSRNLKKPSFSCFSHSLKKRLFKCFNAFKCRRNYHYSKQTPSLRSLTEWE